MAAWSTDVSVPAGADGTIAFIGFYGDGTVEVADKAFAFELDSRQGSLRPALSN
jgi:hypothetical protein